MNKAWIFRVGWLCLLLSTLVIGQSRSSFTISNLRTGEVILDKSGLAIPITVDFEISTGTVTNTLAFIQIEGSKGVGNTCGSGEGAGSKSGTLSCVWKDAKYKAPKKNKTLRFKLAMATPYGDSSNSLEGTITLP